MGTFRAGWANIGKFRVISGTESRPTIRVDCYQTATAMRNRIFSLSLVIVVVMLSINHDYVPILREFNYDIPRMVKKMAKHPLVWINWGRIAGMIGIALVMWRRDYDGDAFQQRGLWPSAAVAFVFGIGAGLLLFLYLREGAIKQANQLA